MESYLMQIILFNSPPGSGKTTAAQLLYDVFDKYEDVHVFKYAFSRPLKEATHAMYGIDYPWDAFEPTKDLPQEKFFGLTPRQAYIKVSEEMVKPVLGNDHWGKVFAAHAEKFNMLIGETVIIISDCGFKSEVDALKKKIGADNITLVRLTREGTSFVNDSRSYVEDKDIFTATFDNNGDIAELNKHMQMLGGIILNSMGIYNDE